MTIDRMLAYVCTFVFVVGTLPAFRSTAAARVMPVPTPSPPSPIFCPVSPTVAALDDAGRSYAVTFSSPEEGMASGTVALYAGDQRYDIPFHDAIVRVVGTASAPNASITTVAFPFPTRIDSAVVTTLGLSPAEQHCEVPFQPWVARSGTISVASPALRARAEAVTPVPAPNAVPDPVSCERPYRDAATVRAAGVFWPSDVGPMNTTSQVLVFVGPDNAVVTAQIYRSSGNAELDDQAVNTARRSKFATQRYRCRPVYAEYIFSVGFNAIR